MNLTNIATSAGGATTPATGQYVVGTPVANPPLRFFRRVVYLRFVVGEMVDRFTIDKQATVLKAAFQTYTYNVVDNGSPDPAASIGPSSGAVIVKLNAPRQL